MLPSTKRALDHKLATEQHNRRMPSVTAAVVRDGEAVWTGARGQVGGAAPTENTQYRIGSITKTFVAVLIMRLRDEGKLNLDDQLATHVPGTSFGNRTIGQLLTHSSGITAEPAGEWWERSAGKEWADLAAQTGPATVRTWAGRRFHYSNLGFAALGEVVARSRGTDWWTAVRDEITRPLGMTRTTPMPEAPHAEGFAVHPWADVLLPEPAHDAKGMAPAGQLWSTATDLARWSAFVGGDTGDVLSADTMAEMREPAVLDDEDDWAGGHAIGLQLMRDKGRRLAGHTGSMPGFVAAVWAAADESTGAVILVNATTGAPTGTLAADLVDILVTREPKTPAEWTPMPTVDDAVLELAGPWYWGTSGVALHVRAGKWLELVSIRGGDDEKVRFRPEPDGTWTGLGGYYAGETLRVVRGAGGSISHLDLNTFVLTRTPYDPAAPIPGGLDGQGWRGLPD